MHLSRKKKLCVLFPTAFVSLPKFTNRIAVLRFLKHFTHQREKFTYFITSLVQSFIFCQFDYFLLFFCRFTNRCFCRWTNEINIHVFLSNSVRNSNTSMHHNCQPQTNSLCACLTMRKDVLRLNTYTVIRNTGARVWVKHIHNQQILCVWPSVENRTIICLRLYACVCVSVIHHCYCLIEKSKKETNTSHFFCMTHFFHTHFVCNIESKLIYISVNLTVKTGSVFIWITFLFFYHNCITWLIDWVPIFCDVFINNQQNGMLMRFFCFCLFLIFFNRHR